MPTLLLAIHSFKETASSLHCGADRLNSRTLHTSIMPPRVTSFPFLSYGFGGYFQFLPGSEWSALMLTYGFPLTIIGFALKVGGGTPGWLGGYYPLGRWPCGWLAGWLAGWHLCRNVHGSSSLSHFHAVSLVVPSLS